MEVAATGGEEDGCAGRVESGSVDGVAANVERVEGWIWGLRGGRDVVKR